MRDAKLHRYYLERLASVEFIVALYINMGLSALFFQKYAEVPLFGASSIFGDLVGTGIILPIVISLIIALRVRRHRRIGELPTLPAAGRGASRLLPSPLWLRAIVLVIHGVVAAVLVTFVLWILRVENLGFWPFVLFTGSFAAVLAAYVVAISGYRVFAEDDAPQGV